jgi:protocatechuate 3,4-dioxygenase beta subunit
VGRYEIETVIPPPYYDPDDVCDCQTSSCLCAWRCPHIHAYVQPLPQTNCQELITQLYFDGEKYNDTDKHYTHKTSMKLTKYSHSNGNSNSNPSEDDGVSWFQGNFDIVLSKSL